MPITQSESGLSSGDYTALSNQILDPDFQILAHRYNLSFSDYSTSGASAAADDARDFDTIEFAGSIYRVAGSALEKLAGSVWAAVTGYSSATGLATNAMPSIVEQGGTLSVFLQTVNGISVNTSSNGTSWSGWSTVVADVTIVFMAAVTGDRVHFIVKDATKKVYNLKVAKYSSSWAVTASDVQYSYPISSFDAVTLNGEDILVMTAQVPGAVSEKAVNNQTVKYVLVAGGVIAFKYKYDSWSDHIVVDIVDEMSAWRYRNNVRAVVIRNRIYLTCYSSDGSEAHPITFYRMFTSADGYWWSRGEAIPVEEDQGNSITFLASGNYIYAFERKKVYRSYSTLFTGLSPTAMQLDITNWVAGAWNLSLSDVSQLGAVLDNSTDWVSGSILNSLNIVALEIYLGYFLPGATESTLVKVATLEVDSLEEADELPDHMLRISARDRMAWMLDKSQSEDFIWKQSQILGGDEYSDVTGTGYGGLGHTAQTAGSFSTVAGTLQLQSNNKEGLAFYTWDDATWNGMVETSVMLDTAVNGEYVGLVFRAQDRDNMRSVLYDQATDKLQLRSRIGGVWAALASSASTLGWTVKTTYYIRVYFRYSRIIAYTSTDGITWAQQISYIDDGYSPALGITGTPIPKTVPVQSGFVGVIGRGYAKVQDAWPGDPGSITPPSYPPDSGYITIGDTGTIVTGDPIIVDPTKLKMFAVGSITSVGYAMKADTVDLNTGAANWSIMQTWGGDAPTWGCADPFNYSRRFIALALGGVYRCDDCWAVGATFTLVATWATIFGVGARYGEHIMMSHNKKNWIMVQSGNMVSVSFDLGVTWSTPVAMNGGSPSYQNVAARLSSWKSAIANFNDSVTGYIWGMALTDPNGSLDVTFYKSTDYGLTWTTHTPNLSSGAFAYTAGFAIPYVLPSGSFNVNGAGHNIYILGDNNGGGTVGNIFRSQDNLATYQRIEHQTSYTPGVPTGIGHRPLVISSENGSIMYAFYRTSGPFKLYKSIDGGVTWIDTGSTASATLIDPSLTLWSIGSGDYLLAFGPAASNGYIYLSSNGGTTLLDTTPIISGSRLNTYFAEFDLSDYIPPQ